MPIPKFFVAKRGSAQRIGYADDFIQELETKGVTVTEINGSVYTHSGINAAIGDSGETTVTDAIDSFFC